MGLGLRLGLGLEVGVGVKVGVGVGSSARAAKRSAEEASEHRCLCRS